MTGHAKTGRERKPSLSSRVKARVIARNQRENGNVQADRIAAAILALQKRCHLTLHTEFPEPDCPRCEANRALRLAAETAREAGGAKP